MSSAQSDKVVLITGATRGIGLGLAQLYSSKGFRVLATARDPTKAKDLQALAKSNNKVHVLTLDVSDSKNTDALPAAIRALGVDHIDVAINNAGILGSGWLPLEEQSIENFTEVFRTNVIGTWHVSQLVLPFLRQSKEPKLVHISSLAGSIKAANDHPLLVGLAAGYRISKAALNDLAAIQSREYNAKTLKAQQPKQDGKTNTTAAASQQPLITVLAVHPGVVDTDMAAGFETVIGFKPPTTVSQSAAGIEKVVSTSKPSPIAVFVDFEGKPMDW